MSSMQPAPTLAIRESRVRRYYDLVDSGDVTALVNLFADDAVYHRPGYPPLTGRTELERFYRADRIIREGRHSLSALVGSATEIAVHGEFHGVLRNGQNVSLRFADFFSFTDEGTFARRDTFFFAPMV
ncbi:nuclear transport factor 2 family protein [Micromonospora haikouensis]|uniref:nuclear transport factor 2 family protein n=1 Tax=Micromonospora haikouensis TaxID=686309 RepID=UPI003D7550FB